MCWFYRAGYETLFSDLKSNVAAVTPKVAVISCPCFPLPYFPHPVIDVKPPLPLNVTVYPNSSPGEPSDSSSDSDPPTPRSPGPLAKYVLIG